MYSYLVANVPLKMRFVEIKGCYNDLCNYFIFPKYSGIFLKLHVPDQHNSNPVYVRS